jgi:uncharacterized protein (DUF488 family)
MVNMMGYNSGALPQTHQVVNESVTATAFQAVMVILNRRVSSRRFYNSEGELEKVIGRASRDYLWLSEVQTFLSHESLYHLWLCSLRSPTPSAYGLV